MKLGTTLIAITLAGLATGLSTQTLADEHPDPLDKP
jgi:hypothetical protein